ncbi:response regulator [Caldichromatium japonicum]|uniref:Sensory/regulatory protein RpfC n=1 Tax=Caldichromatium japonicum TaxID=2699430 RepID=A0A6G7VBZ2_9GAMM|nr:response regulator [Caldichromatium japonicum]QIK37484.1 response regulator [Caldichromatium japonicum]
MLQGSTGKRVASRPFIALGLALLAMGMLIWFWLAQAKMPRPVRVGLYQNPPKVYRDEIGRPAGLFIELLEAIARAEGWRLSYEDCEWPDCLNRLKRGALDLMPDVAYTAERAERFDFHQVSVAGSWSQIYSRPDLAVAHLGDLAGRRVALLRGSVQQEFFDQLMKNAEHPYEPILVESLEAGYAAVAAGQADAVVTNSFFAAHNGARYHLRETPILFLPTALYFAAPKGRSADLLARIDHYLAAWRSEPDSVYFKAVQRAMALPPEVRIPPILRWWALGLGSALILLLGLNLMLRWLVNKRNQALTQTTHELEYQRAHLEQLVAARTAELEGLMEEMRLARAQAESASRFKSEFLANMSHEIRTPLNAVLGMLHLVLRKELTTEVRDRLTKAQCSAKLLLGLINDILDLSKIEAGKLEIELTEFKLDALIDQVKDTIDPQALAKGIAFSLHQDLTIPPILIGDPLRLNQVILNLCSNALKFTERGEIELRFEALEIEEKELVLQVMVRDTGIGIAPEVQAYLFEPFTQADRSTTRRFGGTGLGLAISRRLIEQMGGRIWLAQSAPGQGSTFCFALPLGVARKALAERQELLAQIRSLLKRLRILVVDSNPSSCARLSELLRSLQLEVMATTEAGAALSMLRDASGYDLAFIDCRLIDMTGQELIRRIHQDLRITPRPKLILISDHGRDEMQCEADGLLIRPISSSFLLDTLLSVLGHGRLLKAEGLADEGPAVQACGWSGLDHPAGMAEGALTGARILLVEDNEINREFACELLRSLGATVDEAADGAEALERVQQATYDAVLMDIQMQVMDGLEAARHIRALGEQFAGLPIIAMTALAMAEDHKKALAAGMNDYLSKPIDPEHLFAVLCRWLTPAGQAQLPPPAAVVKERLPPEFAALHSLDVHAGIQRIGGKIDAYRKQLSRFHQRYTQASLELESLACDQGPAVAQSRCHALKGLIANLGAKTLFDQINAIDDCLKRNQLPPADAWQALHRHWQTLIDEIDGLERSTPVEGPAQSKTLSPDELRDLVERLLRALNDDLGAIDHLLSELRAGTTGTGIEDELAAIAADCEVFAIDEALARTQRLRQTLAAG